MANEHAQQFGGLSLLRWGPSEFEETLSRCFHIVLSIIQTPPEISFVVAKSYGIAATNTPCWSTEGCSYGK